VGADPLVHMPANVLVACHAGDGVGLGHLSRSLVAAKALRSRLSVGVRLLVQGNQINRSDLDTFPHRFITKDQDLSKVILDEYARQCIDLVVFDLHPESLPTPASMQAMLIVLQSSGCRLVAIDGLLQYRAILDLIFIPSFHHAAPADASNAAPIVFGWDCFLLNLHETPSDWQPGRRVLALTGGSDATGLGQTWPTIIDATLPSDTECHWVTGPFAHAPALPQAPRIQFHPHIAPSGLGPLMQASNYAITVFGVSFFELIYLGIPTVVFSPYGGKDDRELGAITKAGAALVARDEREATDRLSALMHDDGMATQLSLNARALLTTPGGCRLCAEIASLMPPVPCL